MLYARHYCLPDSRVKAQKVAGIGHDEWSGDKYAALTEGKIYPEAYLTYQNKLRQTKGLREEPGIKPSINFWRDDNGDTSVTNFQLEAFPIDSKTIGAAGIEYFIQSQITKAHDRGEVSDWQLIGNLLAEERCFSPSLKAQNKSQVRQGMILSMLQTRELIQTNRQVISHTRSPSPHPGMLPEQPIPNATSSDLNSNMAPQTTSWTRFKRNEQIRSAMYQYPPPKQSIFFSQVEEDALEEAKSLTDDKTTPSKSKVHLTHCAK